MKKMYTRFLALVMAFAMALSCTAVASAAEVDFADETSAVYTDASTGDEGVMPLSGYHPVYEATGSTTGTTTINNVSIASNNEVAIIIASNVDVKVMIYKRFAGSGGGDLFVSERKIQSTNNKGLMISLGSGYSGGVYKFVISPDGTGSYSMALGLVY